MFRILLSPLVLCLSFAVMAAAEQSPDTEAAKPKVNRADKFINIIDGYEVRRLRGDYRTISLGSVSGESAIVATPINVDSFELGDLSGNAKVRIKGLGKRLWIASVSGAAELDASDFDVDEVEIVDVGGGASLVIRARGKVTLGSYGGDAKVRVTMCKDFIAKQQAGSGRVEVNYTGTANCPPGSQVKLNKVEPPK